MQRRCRLARRVCAELGTFKDHAKLMNHSDVKNEKHSEHEQISSRVLSLRTRNQSERIMRIQSVHSCRSESGMNVPLLQDMMIGEAPFVPVTPIVTNNLAKRVVAIVSISLIGWDFCQTAKNGYSFPTGQLG